MLDFREREKFSWSYVYDSFWSFSVICLLGLYSKAARDHSFASIVSTNAIAYVRALIHTNNYAYLYSTWFISNVNSKRNAGQRNPLTHKTACILNNLKHIYMRAHHYHIFSCCCCCWFFFLLSFHLTQIKVFLKANHTSDRKSKKRRQTHIHKNWTSLISCSM